MMLAQFAIIAPLNTLRGSTREELRSPRVTFSKPTTRLLLLNHATTNNSDGSSLNRGWNNSKKSLGEVIFFFGISEWSGYLKLVSLNFQTRVLNLTILSFIIASQAFPFACILIVI